MPTLHARTGDGLRLQVVEHGAGHAGAGVPVLCLHGLTRNGRDFSRLAQRLSPRHRLLLADQRGRGGSDRDPDPAHYQPLQYAADMLGLLDQLEIAQCVIVGTSMGGMVGLLMAVQQPARVRALVLNDVGAQLERAGLARIAAYVGKQPACATLDEAAARLAATQGPVFPGFGPEDWVQMAWETHAEHDGLWVPDYDPAIAQGLANGSAAPPLWPLFEQLGSLPLLLLRGALSDLLSAATVAEMQRRLPQLEAVEVPGCGHAPTLLEPRAFSALNGFLARHCG